MNKLIYFPYERTYDDPSKIATTFQFHRISLSLVFLKITRPKVSHIIVYAVTSLSDSTCLFNFQGEYCQREATDVFCAKNLGVKKVVGWIRKTINQNKHCTHVYLVLENIKAGITQRLAQPAKTPSEMLTN